MVSSAFFLYSIVFLELKPYYLCQDATTLIWSSCTTSQFCGKPEQTWKVDFDNYESLHNLIEQLDFYCASDFAIGAFGVCFLLGIVIGCFTLARAGDVVGRRPIFILGMLI